MPNEEIKFNQVDTVLYGSKRSENLLLFFNLRPDLGVAAIDSPPFSADHMLFPMYTANRDPYIGSL
jgi:hypothetical protein